MRVTDPFGRRWQVRRRWMLWRRRLRGDFPDLPVSNLGDDPISAVIGVILLIIALPFIVLFFLVVIEVLLLLALLPLVLLARSAFGVPWTIEVTYQGTWHGSESIVGLGASAARRDAITDALHRGIPVPAPVVADTTFRGSTGRRS